MTEAPKSDFPPADSPDPLALAGQILVEVNISDDRWLERLPGLEALARETARDAFLAGCGSMGVGAAAVEISLTFANDQIVRELNAEHRELDRPTNVLSFPAVPPENVKQTIEAFCSAAGNGGAAPELLLGDVILALETIMREAEEQRKRPADHVAHLVAHGVLHLLGFDHCREDEATRMERIEVRIMENLGIGDPYQTGADRATAPVHGGA